MRLFRCPVTILNTIDYLGKFDGKADEGFFVGYSVNSKAFKVFNSRTRIVEENLHIRFSESTPNAVGSGQDWLFDIDALTRTMNYEPIVAGIQPNGFADPRKDSGCNDQENEDNVNSTNNINAAGINEVNVVGGKTSIELPFDPNMHALEDYSIFNLSRDDEDDNAVADINNLDTTIQVSPIPTTRIHKDHPLDQEEPKKVIHALKDPIWIEAMHEDYYNQVLFSMGRLKNRCMYVNHQDLKKPDCPDRVYKVEKHSMDYIKLLNLWYKNHVNKSFGQKGLKEGKLTRPYSSKGTKVYNKKSDCKPTNERPKPLLKDEDGEEVDVYIRRSNELVYLMNLNIFKIDIMYLKGQPKLGLWYPKDSPFELVAYTDSDYSGASLDRKSTTGGKAKKSVKLMMEKLFRMELELMLVTQS
ncbi:putative ribonuclease H-like domain-containing protein [Tanacetum coccineum]|uniref:Ribonuclease H-like domain-containing protein n=1 Tax=Tanacetum coccineum TaxID=301880 RepID=A0ABQ5ALY4_9ASTR